MGTPWPRRKTPRTDAEVAALMGWSNEIQALEREAAQIEQDSAAEGGWDGPNVVKFSTRLREIAIRLGELDATPPA